MNHDELLYEGRPVVTMPPPRGPLDCLECHALLTDGRLYFCAPCAEARAIKLGVPRC